ncbi:MAG TPA: M13 family metallopeptidase, partial [Longimicrobiaceae bacterium]|nr:M13 family metallopeptidase [Longimicrobiaceae bacterium]
MFVLQQRLERSFARILGVILVSATLPAALAAQGTALGVDTTNFDTSVRPKDDFFEYVNGTWLEETEIPDDRSSYGAFVELREESERALRAIVEEAAAANDSQPGTDLWKVGALYRSFMDTGRIEELGITPVQPYMAQVEAIDDIGDLAGAFAHFRKLGITTPLGFYVGQDAKASDTYIVYFSQSGLGLPDRDYYFREGAEFDETRAAYLAYIEDLLRLADHEDPAAAAERIMALESRLAEYHWERARNRDRNATYNRFTVAELQELSPVFDWSTFLTEAGAGEVDEVIVRQPDYIEGMNEVLAASSPQDWRDYFTFHLLDAAAPYLSSEFVKSHFEFHGSTMQGLEVNRPRWKRGVDVVDGLMGEALGRMYVERHFQPEARARMQELVDNLRAAFAEGIGTLEWMSPETQAAARAKLAKFNTKIGYPDEWQDYSALEVREGDLVGNLLRGSEFGYNEMIDHLGEPVDREEWGMTPQTVNAYYSSTMNEIVFPAAILQPPFFNVAADDAVNYGAIGAVIGHEISHGFDDQGRKSDGDGNLRDWWTAEDAAAFEARADRLVEQYNSYNPVD